MSDRGVSGSGKTAEQQGNDDQDNDHGGRMKSVKQVTEQT